MTFSGLLDRIFRPLTASFVQFKYTNGVNKYASHTDGRGLSLKVTNQLLNTEYVDHFGLKEFM